MQTTGLDSAGKSIKVGDAVRYRGREYVIKSFEPGKGRFGTAGVTFTEQSHINWEEPDEFGIDRVD